MAKDGDIIDVMFGWIISLFGWIFGGIVKLIMAIIGGLFKSIVGLFKKDNTNVQDQMLMVYAGIDGIRETPTEQKNSCLS